MQSCLGPGYWALVAKAAAFVIAGLREVTLICAIDDGDYNWKSMGAGQLA